MATQNQKYIQLGIKDWASVVDALGKGVQTLLIRPYPPKNSQFLLYPTFSYFAAKQTKPVEFDQYFEAKHREAARIAGIHAMNRAQQNAIVDISYFAVVDTVVEVTDKSVYEALQPFFVWSLSHLSEYLTETDKPSHLWLIRTYRLPKPTTVVFEGKRGGSLTTYKHAYPISTLGSSPVLTNSQFGKLKTQILSTIERMNVVPRQS